MKICFHSCRYQNQNFSLLSQSCRLRRTQVTLFASCHTCLVRVSLVSVVSQCRRTDVALVVLMMLVFGTCPVKWTRSVKH